MGDISYADGSLEIWDTFMDAVQPLSSRLPYMVQVGNHEAGYSHGAAMDPSGQGGPYQPPWGNYGADSGGECGVMIARVFHMPEREARADNPPFWYGWDYGPVHFTAISTEHDLTPGSVQYAWLEAELAAVDRCATPWLVLLLHRPMYVVYPHNTNREVGEHIRGSIEGLLQRYLVDVAISGHVHSYYATCAVYDEACVDGGGGGGGDRYRSSTATNGTYNSSSSTNGSSSSSSSSSGGSSGDAARHGTVHIVVGSAGRSLSDFEDGQEDWVAVAEKVWGYTRFEVEGGDSMAVEFVKSETGAVVDRFEVEPSAARRANACPGRQS